MKRKACAKINLSLDVLNKRPDGYHNVKMIMQQIELADEVSVNLTDGGITLSSNSPLVPCDSGNTAYKAAELMLNEAGQKCGVHIHIEKRIPVSAGLAGGSTDGAAVLSCLNEMLGLNFGNDKLMGFAASLGSDIPFCIMGGTALAEGTGTDLSALPPFPQMTVLLVKPPMGVSTPWVYKNLDLNEIAHPETNSIIKYLHSGETDKIFSISGNVLESVTASRYPIIDKIKSDMRKHGAAFSMMSGSGPTVFGIFENENAAKAAEKYFKKSFDEVIITKTV